MDANFAAALQHHQAGRLREAEALYRKILTENPRHAEARHYLGALAHQAGNNEAALELFRQALALAPDYAEAWANLGHVLARMGRHADAVAAYETAAALQPSVAEHAYALGLMLARIGQYAEARQAFLRAITLRADYAEAHCDLADALGHLGDHDAALAALRRALALKPDFAAAWCNLGNECCRRKQFDEALVALQRALQSDPRMAAAYGALGQVHGHRGEIDAALGASRRAVELNPRLATAHATLGALHAARGDADGALRSRRRALDLDPDDPAAHSAVIFTMLSHPATGPADMTNELARWEEKHARPLERAWRPHENTRDPERRLRVGYVSSDFWDHVTALYHVPLIEHHDVDPFDLFCYAHEHRSDGVTARLKLSARNWRNTRGLSDEQVAEQIRADGIDILVDLQLHTAGNRLLIFARKPAPVQVTWMGYPGSTGLHAIDYRLTDPHLDPPGPDDRQYAEESWRLPHTFWCYDPRSEEPRPSLLPARHAGVITFGCLHGLRKVNEGVLRQWAQVLAAVERSRLVLLAPEGSHRHEILACLARHGVAAERVEFRPPRGRDGYLKYFHGIDITLDTFPYNGHTSSLDSFWMGVPVVTLVGGTVVGRAGLSQSANLGLPELAAKTPEEFVAIAAKLAGDMSRLEALRASLRERMRASPLMDFARYTREVEAAYRAMWRKWCTRA